MVNARVAPSREGADQPDLAQVIDADVHPYTPAGLESVMPYMPSAWRKRFELKGASAAVNSLTIRYQHPNGRTTRLDSIPPSGGPGGSDPDYVVQDLLENHSISCAILNALQPAVQASALAGAEESVVLCSAFNDYYISEWLPIDRRFRYAISIPSQEPECAAAEISRLAGVDGVVGASIPMLNILMGNRHYYPIYEAAEAASLPLMLHLTGTEYVYQGGPVPAGGQPGSYAERFVTLPQVGAANLASLIFSGTLERFRSLRVLFVEYGFTWAVPLMWRMDQTWRAMRKETPWVQKPPSEYIRDRIRFTTQPLEGTEHRDLFRDMVAALGPEVLLFSTDYPHWDNDMPATALRGLSLDDRRGILAGNAIAFFGGEPLGIR